MDVGALKKRSSTSSLPAFWIKKKLLFSASFIKQKENHRFVIENVLLFYTSTKEQWGVELGPYSLQTTNPFDKREFNVF